jgi:recombinational DNA repair ATPase RecF
MKTAHLENISINTFANLANFKIDKLKQFNLLIGKTMSGKQIY